MKRAISVILTLILCLGLVGCGKSEAVKNVEAMIDGIGTVSIGSLDAIQAAMDAYEALTEEEAAKVENVAALTEAQDACLTLHLMGNWVYNHEYYNDVESQYDRTDLALREDMTAEGQSVSGVWRVENGELKINNGEYDITYHIYQEDGKLSVGSVNSKMIRTEDYNALLDEMFVTVEITPETVSDYCRVILYTQIVEDAFGLVTGDTRTYAALESTVYDDGLIYFEASDDLAIELLVPEHKYQYIRDGRKPRNYTDEADTYVVQHNPYGSYGASLGNKNVESGYEYVHDITADQISFGRAAGKITFIRSSFVQEVRQDDEHSSSRVIVLNTGKELYSGTWRDQIVY